MLIFSLTKFLDKVFIQLEEINCKTLSWKGKLEISSDSPNVKDHKDLALHDTKLIKKDI